MSEDLFESPTNSPYKSAFSKQVDEINEGVKTYIQAVFNFDTCHTFEDLEFSADLSFVKIKADDYRMLKTNMLYCRYKKNAQTPLTLTRNFQDLTQRIFGFAHDNQPQVKQIGNYAKSIELNLIGSSLSQNAIKYFCLSNYNIKVNFDSTFYESEITLRFDDENGGKIYNRIAHVELVLQNETLEELVGLKVSVYKMVDEIYQIETMCKMGSCYNPYRQLVE